MKSGVDKCITMRLLSNILRFILIINIKYSIKINSIKWTSPLTTVNASHTRTEFWVIKILYLWITESYSILNAASSWIPLVPWIQYTVENKLVYMSWSVYMHMYLISKYTLYIFLDQWNKTINMYSTFTTFIFSIIFMALNNLIDKKR